MSRIVIAHHGHCFDGMASAALLARFLRARDSGTEHDFVFRGLDHQPGGSFVPVPILDGDVNAIVDFRYSTAPALTWYFDHHETGITTDEERAHFAADDTQRKFLDPSYGSCCELIADITRERYAFVAPELAELVTWAGKIDAALFANAEEATAIQTPALELMTVIERHGNDRFLAPRIRALSEGETLAALAADPEVQRLLAPLKEQHQKTSEAIRTRAAFDRGVVFFDLVGTGNDIYNKFIPYALFPESRYCVSVTAGPQRTKVSVGSNPWSPVPRGHDIARICERFGGGGHPFVGAVSLRSDQVARAREIATEIAEELKS